MLWNLRGWEAKRYEIAYKFNSEGFSSKVIPMHFALLYQ
jgi:hypothetical protein